MSKSTDRQQTRSSPKSPKPNGATQRNPKSNLGKAVARKRSGAEPRDSSFDFDLDRDLNPEQRLAYRELNPEQRLAYRRFCDRYRRAMIAVGEVEDALEPLIKTKVVPGLLLAKIREDLEWLPQEADLDDQFIGRLCCAESEEDDAE